MTGEAAEAKITKEIKEKYLKHVEEISKGHDNVSVDDFEITEEQQKYIDEEDRRSGFVKVRQPVENEKVKPEPEANKQKPKFTTFKYSSNGTGDPFESVILGGKPCFISYDHKTKKIHSADLLEEAFGTLYPPRHNEISYMPYEFESLEQVQAIANDIVENNIGLDELYSKSKEIMCKFNDQDDYKLTSVASDAIWSYFQDRFTTTRYDMFVGGVGGGKSSLADTFGAIGYRPVNLTDPSAPNLFRILGMIEVGQCTIIMEEAEKIDQFYEIMAVLKTGYHRDKRVSKINNLTMTPEFFYTYCFKIIVAERSPGQNVARGVVDRSLIFNCYKGVPKHDIKEVMNPTNTGGIANKRLLNELKEFRNQLLIYRLIHFKDDIPDVDIGIIGRDKELIKPTLQLFQDTKSKDQLIAAFQTILDLKNQRKGASLEAQLLLTLRKVVGKQRPELDSKQKEIPFKTYWNQLRDDLVAIVDEKKPGEMHTAEYGTLYGSTIGSALHDKFGAESKHTKNGNLLIIDYNTLEKLEKIHETKIIVKKIADVQTEYVEDGEGGEHGEGTRKTGYEEDTESKRSDQKEEKNSSKEEDLLSPLPSLPVKKIGTVLFL